VTTKNGAFWGVTLVRTDVSEELSASIIKVTRMMMEELSSSETSDLIRVTRRNIPEEVVLLFHGLHFCSWNKKGIASRQVTGHTRENTGYGKLW
jgi:hypothetical protein